MERLYLKWKDKNNKIYAIATLYRYEGYYYLMINSENIKKAKNNGCTGIGKYDSNQAGYKSKELLKWFWILPIVWLKGTLRWKNDEKNCYFKYNNCRFMFGNISK